MTTPRESCRSSTITTSIDHLHLEEDPECLVIWRSFYEYLAILILSVVFTAGSGLLLYGLTFTGESCGLVAVGLVTFLGLWCTLRLCRGRVPWVFDRVSGFFRRGKSPVRPLDSIEYVAIWAESFPGQIVYYVSLGPPRGRTILNRVIRVLRNDLFILTRKSHALELAGTLARFLRVRVEEADLS